MARPATFHDFVHDTAFDDLSPQAVAQVKRFILDLTGTAMGGVQTDLSRIIRTHADRHFGAGHGGAARMVFDGRAVSPVGAALAGGMSIDALDGHDGQKLTKGHVGCAVFPSVLAMMEAEVPSDGRELITSMAIGYEIGTRAGIALHATAPDYHTSGAWIAIACAALGARRLGLGAKATREAIGIAEYHGPRSQMMRCIDHPTMVKDGSGWGAMAGVSAAYLAADGFTGAPAITVEDAGVADIWADLGQREYLFEQYIKLFPVCRWAQPPLQAVLDLRAQYGLVSQDVDRIEVETFHESVRLAVRHPKTTEEAQYSTAYPTAVGMVRGRVGPGEVSATAFADREVARLAGSMTFIENEDYNAAFPARRFAHVTLVLRDGRRLVSPRTEALGDPEAPLDDAAVAAKFHALADPIVGAQQAAAISSAIAGLDREGGLTGLTTILYAPIGV